MISMNQLKNGISNYLASDVSAKIPDEGKRFMFDVATELMVSSLENYLDHPLIGALAVIEGDNVDIDTIYRAAKKRANNPITVRVPLIGNLKFTAADIDRMYQTIMQS